MAGAKPTSTLLCTTTPLKLLDRSALANAKMFRAIIGALQYLTLTRPDLSFSINKLSQFMHQPTQIHFQQLKRILRYIKLTFNFGLQLKKPPHLHLHAFSDADWGSNLDDMTSTSAFVIYFGGNPVSCLSKIQKIVARSSTKAEYRSVANTSAEVMWLCTYLGNLLVQLGKIRVSHISTKDQLADILTKPLSRARFVPLRVKLVVTDGEPS
ncbi:PREDICTED: uncharacterized protein LOC109327732 [Lupinus angustifolius]|uniref:uncharacterized protein LOC109327732 n=1 Tax=Lupinus angustifolius TaxID=3871 RepID=UPI00092EB30F|nr:PREDICTED: uncharacterized protein LOC109327732 [Lupinus angustifolius]